MSFVHLHTHSEYSLSSSLLKVSDITRGAREHGAPAVALTDWCNLYGALYLWKAAKAAGIKPIYGMEMGFVVPGSPEVFRHGVLLAENMEGFKNLCTLSSLAHTQFGLTPEELRPHLPLEVLFEHKNGLILLTGGLKGLLNSFFIQDQHAMALDVLESLKKNFGPDHLFLELQDSSLSLQQRCNDWLLDLGKNHKLPCVVTCEAHYKTPEDALAQEFWMMVERKQTLEENPRNSLGSQDYCFKSPEDVKANWENHPEVIDNTLKIAERCNVKLKFEDADGKRIFHLPDFDVQGTGCKDANEFFGQEAAQGLTRRLAQMKVPAEQHALYQERLDFEINVICKMGFAGYYLIVSDFIRWAKKNDIAVGPGRGSGAGSLVAWCLDITDLDPIEHGLLFERFLNPERVSLPDFDIDFCQQRRHEVIRYVGEKYGKDRVCQIITFAKEQSKNAIKDVGRVLGLSFTETNRITKLIPSEQAKPLSIKESLEKVKELQDLVADNPKIRQDIEIGQRIEGALRQPGVHAAGVIIASRPIQELAPVSADVNGNVITQWDMKMVEEAGLVKFDFLGLVTLDLLDLACNWVNRRPEPQAKTLKYDNIPMHDPRAIKLIADGDTMGIFQFESSGMQNICTRIKPDRFSDLAAITALFRPGPLEAGMVDDYIARKHGKAKVEVVFPEMEPILRETYGTIVYQEQVLQIAQAVAGFSLGKADLLRRAMGKKIQKEMEEQRTQFVDGAVRAGKPANQAGTLFDSIEKFAGYGFNKSHAAAYGVLSSQTAYLKAVYPTEFFTALLTIDKENTDKLSRYITDARKHGIKVLPPDVNESESDFSITQEGVIRFGLSAIKNVGEGVVEDIIAVRRKDGPFKDLFDFVQRCGERALNKRTVECLISAGAFDALEGLGDDDRHRKIDFRAKLLATVETAIEWGASERRQISEGQTSLFGAVDSSGQKSSERPRFKDGAPMTYKQMLDAERTLMGVYVSGHPLDRFQDRVAELRVTSVFELSEKEKSGVQTLAVVVSELREVKVKKGKMVGQSMAILKLEDLTGTIEMVSFPEHYSNFGELLRSGEPLIVRGEVEYEEGQAKMLASRAMVNGLPSVEDLAQTETRWPKEVGVDINLDMIPTGAEEVFFSRLADVLKKHPGPVAVRLSLIRPGTFESGLELASDCKVVPDRGLLEGLDQLSYRPGQVRVDLVHG